MESKHPEKTVSDKAVAASRAIQKKREAAPSWSDYVSRYGEQGAVRNSRGKIVGYKLPQHDDPQKNRRIAEEEFERWQPHRRLAIAHGGEANASIPTTTLIDRKTGAKHVVPEAVAARRARNSGLIEEAKARGCRVEAGVCGGMLWKWAGSTLRWVPMGVRCLGQPMDGGPREISTKWFQFDPDGLPWKWSLSDGAWVRVKAG